MLSKEFATGKYSAVAQENHSNQHRFIAAANQLLMRRQGHSDTSLYPPPAFDPFNILRDAIDGGDFVFERDCSIQLAKTVDGQLSEAIPNNFHKGDLVEAEISFIAIPNKARRMHHLKVLLRKMKLLDSSFSTVRILIATSYDQAVLTLKSLFTTP